MHATYKKQLHEWAQTVTFQEVLEETAELCVVKGIECTYCDGEAEVYCVYWKRGIDYYCRTCLENFINTEYPKANPSGNLRRRILIFERDNFKCVYCGRNPIDHETTLEIDHVHPVSKGGKDTENNLVTACRECNAGKGDYLLNQRDRAKATQSRR